MAQADQRTLPRVRDAGKGQAGELRGGQRGGALQDVVRHRRSGGGDGHCGAGVQAVRRGIRGQEPARRGEGVDVAGEVPQCGVPQSAGGVDRRVRRRQLRRRSALGGGGIVPDHGRRRVSEVLPGALRGVCRFRPGGGAAIVAERGQPRAVDVCVGRRQGRRSHGAPSARRRSPRRTRLWSAPRPTGTASA